VSLSIQGAKVRLVVSRRERFTFRETASRPAFLARLCAMATALRGHECDCSFADAERIHVSVMATQSRGHDTQELKHTKPEVERRLHCPLPHGSEFTQENPMITSEMTTTREQLIEDLNGDLAREYQAVIAYVVYSQVLKGAEYMAIAKELEVHATEELQHALTVAKQIDYLGGVPTVEQEPVKMSSDAAELLRFDLENEVETIRNYRQRVRQAESLGEYAIAEQIREILVQEQEHLIDLATALGEDAPKITDGETV